MSTFVEWHFKSWGEVWPGLWGEEGLQGLFPKYDGGTLWECTLRGVLREPVAYLWGPCQLCLWVLTAQLGTREGTVPGSEFTSASKSDQLSTSLILNCEFTQNLEIYMNM